MLVAHLGFFVVTPCFGFAIRRSEHGAGRTPSCLARCGCTTWFDRSSLGHLPHNFTGPPGRRWTMRRFLVLSVGVIVAACSGGSPTRPSARVTHTPAAGDSTAGALHNPNSPPALELRTTPRQVNGVGRRPPPSRREDQPVQDQRPLTRATHSNSTSTGEMGFRQVSITPAQAPTLGMAGHPRAGGGPGCCRHRHRFDSAGAFTVTAEVSDKHLEDQSGDVSALAISTATFVVKAGSAPEATPTPVPTCAASGRTLYGLRDQHSIHGELGRSVRG